MRKKQFNGYHWDPFLMEVMTIMDTPMLEFDYGGKMSVFIGNSLLYMESQSNGFKLSDGNASDERNTILEKLISDNMLTSEGILTIKQNDEGIDLEDRIERVVAFLKTLQPTA